jgi:hypothetical protein
MDEGATYCTSGAGGSSVADSYLIRNGRIDAMMIHYTVVKSEG